MSPIDLAKIEQQLMAANAIVAQINPLVGAVDALGVVVLQLLRKAGLDSKTVTTFEQQWSTWQTQRQGLAAALDEFHQKYPQSAAPPSATPQVP